MLTAREAREETRRVIDALRDEELLSIQTQINQAISEGKYAICNEGILSQDQVGRLRELGYIVQLGNQYNEPFYGIGWEEVRRGI